MTTGADDGGAGMTSRGRCGRTAPVKAKPRPRGTQQRRPAFAFAEE